MFRDTRREVLSLYRSALRASRRFDFPSSPGEALWSRVLAVSARSEFEAHRHERDTTEILRLLVVGTDALAQLEARARVAEVRLSHAVDGALSRKSMGRGSDLMVTADASPYALDARAPEGVVNDDASAARVHAAVDRAAEEADIVPARGAGAQAVIAGEAERRAREGLPRTAPGTANASVRARQWTKLHDDSSPTG
jgi:hypothetical protein